MWQYIQTIIRKRAFFTSAVAVVGLSGAILFSPLTLFATVILLASVAVFRLGILARLAASLAFCGLLGAIILQGTTLLHQHVSLNAVLVLVLLMSFLYATLLRDKIDFRTSTVDGLGAVVGVATFVIIAFPIFGASGSKVLENFIPGEDNNSHFQMYRYILEEGKYAYNNTNGQAYIRPSLLSYAQGSHAAMAVVTAPFAEKTSPSRQLIVYAFAAAGMYAVTFWFGFLCVVTPLNKLKDWRLRATLASLAGLFYTIAVPLGAFLSLYTYGYFPQYSAYFGFLFLVLAVILSTADNSKDRRILPQETTLLLVSFYAVFASWYLAAPIAAILLLVFLWLHHKELIMHRVWLVSAASVSAVVFGYLTYVYTVKSTGANHILTTGGVEKLDQWVLIIVVPAIFLTLNFIRSRSWSLIGLSLSLIGAGLMSAGIGYYLWKKLGHFDYYFYKTLFTVVLVAVIYYGYLFNDRLVDVLAYLKPAGLQKLPIILPLLGLLVTTIMITTFSPPKYLESFTRIKYATPQHAPDRLLDIFTNESIYDKYSDVLVLNKCNPYANFTGTIWAGGYFLSYNTEREVLERELLSRAQELDQPNSPLLREIAQYTANKGKPVAVEGKSSCLTRNNLYLQLQGHNVVFITPAGDEDHSPVL